MAEMPCGRRQAHSCVVNDYCTLAARQLRGYPQAMPATPPAPAPHPGLCASCAHRQEVPNTRGSVFWLCRRSRTDPAYPRYPRLPVQECHGYKRLSS